jgi:preprotein translocase SecE subunit
MARVTADSGRGQVGRESRLLSGARNIYEELRKVVWPTREELVKMTGVVVATVIVVALALGAIDYVFNGALLPLENIVRSGAGGPPVTPPVHGLPPP